MGARYFLCEVIIMNERILVDFSCLFDTDYGSVLYLMYKSKKEQFFEEGYKDWTEFYLKCRVITRDKINPLTCLLKPEYASTADKLYEQLLTNKWNDVLVLSPQTDIIRLLHTLYGSKDNRVNVICRNQTEIHFIKYIKWNSMVYENVNMDDYSWLFFHDLDASLDRFNDKLVNKVIYIYHHKPNFLSYRELVPNISLMPYVKSNKIKTISPYRDFEIPPDIIINDMEVTRNGKVFSIK